MEMLSNNLDKDIFNKLEKECVNIVVSSYINNFSKKKIGKFACSDFFIPLYSVKEFRHNKDIHIIFTNSDKNMTYSRKIELTYIQYMENQISNNECIIFINKNKVNDDESLYNMIIEEIDKKSRGEIGKSIVLKNEIENLMEQLVKEYKKEEDEDSSKDPNLDKSSKNQKGKSNSAKTSNKTNDKQENKLNEEIKNKNI
jgi:hypothetical protein